MSLLGRHFWIPAYLALACGFWLPGDWRWLKGGIPWLLGGILFFSCLKMPLADVGRSVRDRELLGRLGWMALLKLVVLPLAVWAAVRPLWPEWAPGIAAVSMMPAGLSTVAFSEMVGAHHALALLYVLGTSILAPFTIPALLQGVGPAGAEVGVLAMLPQTGYILMLLTAPFALAQLVRRLFPALVERHRERLTAGSVLSLVLLIFASVGASRGAWAGWTVGELAMPLVLVSCAALVFAAAGLAMRRAWPKAQADTFAVGAIYMNNGLGVAFTVAFFPGEPRMLLPAVLMQLPMVGLMALFARLDRLPLLRRVAPAPAAPLSPPAAPG